MHSFKSLILNELSEDRIHDDVTTALLGEAGSRRRRAQIVAREAGVFYGQAVLAEFRDLFPELGDWVTPLQDGDSLSEATVAARFAGPVATILGIERTLLNLLSHGCGIATETRRYVDACGDHSTRILATRKTLPGLRDLQLAAVVAGGGTIHRRSLSDGVLIKDNHRQLLSIGELLGRSKVQGSPLHKVEIEVDSLAQLERALEESPDVVMLDNFTDEEIQTALKRIQGRVGVEVSGGVTLDRIPALAAMGVDSISVGRLTHSVMALDLGLDLENEDD